MLTRPEEQWKWRGKSQKTVKAMPVAELETMSMLDRSFIDGLLSICVCSQANVINATHVT